MRHPTFRLPLHTLLGLDALSCAVMGAALLAAPVPLGRWMALPPTLLGGAGLALLLIAAFMAWLACRPAVPRWGLGLVVAGNALWAMGSVLLPMLGLVSPSLPGWLFLLGQAGAVALLAWLEAGARPAPAMA
ncbi:hypothetical protein [Teichococcus oryzae]|uniref:Uncharacterized protein n=1 Tax=Teichococcus oryzae TaxID=1608942 RepID=A0A5B2TBK6_9PROT|nr:hypothetical protein [Pseudoroseomonas oryzae]KAA2211559.1 hypothetical protein F0Q34_19330 [Pseudoroseomonas oryzae]